MESLTDLSEKPMEIVPAGGKSLGIAAPTVKKGQVIQKNYILNDTAALKKKMRQESRKEAYNMGVEARDGSNMVIETKTSFFEHIKACFINDLVKMNGIESVENAVAAKAPTENSGGAFVEYSLDITFRVKEVLYTTKLIAYTTTCRMMFQPVGGNSQVKVNSGNKSVPRYFVDLYFLPWCEDAYANKNYDENLIMEAMRSEVRRLDTIKLDSKKSRGRLASIASSDARCVAKGCKYTGLNSNNKSAVGVCAKCGGFEHFECSKTKQEDREEIQKGNIKYFCSTCFMKNPSSIAFDCSPIRPMSMSKAIIQPRLYQSHLLIQRLLLPLVSQCLSWPMGIQR